MATYRRSTTPGATYFFTLNTYRRQRVLTERPIYETLKQSIRMVKEIHPFTIEAFVLLPDHLHCIWTLPEYDADYGMRWNMIKREVSLSTRDIINMPLTPSRLKRGELGLWQRRFWEHQIRDDRDYEKHINYIHWNPVKHGYVKQASDWPYSSFQRFVERGVYTVDWACAPDVYNQSGEGGFGEMG